MGRLPVDHLPRRRRGRDRQPERAADDQVLPRGRRGRAGEPARALRDRRRDRHPGRRGPGLDFEALLQRIHPADSRVRLLAEQTPAAFVAFDLLALGDEDFTERSVRGAARGAGGGAGRRAAAGLPDAGDHGRRRWPRCGSASSRAPGSTGSSPSRSTATYQPDKRAMFKIKHERTADCVVAGYRVHKSGRRRDRLAAARPVQRRRQARQRRRDRRVPAWRPARRCSPSCSRWSRPSTGTRGTGQPAAETATRHPREAEHSRWNAGKDLSFVPLRPERVVEVQVRPHGGHQVPAHGAVRALAPRPRAGVVRLRPARGAGELQPRRHPRRADHTHRMNQAGWRSCACGGRGRARLPRSWRLLRLGAARRPRHAAGRPTQHRRRRRRCSHRELAVRRRANCSPSGAQDGRSARSAGSGPGTAGSRSPSPRTPGRRATALGPRTAADPALVSAGQVASRGRPGRPSGPLPLIVFGPGFMQCGGPYADLLRAWASAGYVVAAVNFPRSDCLIGDGSDRVRPGQPAARHVVRDHRRCCDAAPRRRGLLAGRLSRREIAIAGQSDGGDTVAAVASELLLHRPPGAGRSRPVRRRVAAMPGTFFARAARADAVHPGQRRHRQPAGVQRRDVPS